MNPHIDHHDVIATISLGMQLLAALLFLITAVAFHGGGIVAATRFMRLEDRALRFHRVDARAFGILIGTTLWLFGLHLMEVAAYAAFYLAVGALKGFEAALFYSLSAYTTLGQPDVNFPDQWRIFGAIEGLVGFLLIGWSTAVFFADMNKLLRE